MNSIHFLLTMCSQVIKVFMFLTCIGFFVNAKKECDTPRNLVFHSPGNVTITGLFDIHDGEKCSISLAKGLEEAASAIWVVSILNQQNYLPGIEIGLSIYDGCSSAEEAKQAFVQSMVYENCLDKDHTTVGIMTSFSIQSSLETLSSHLNKTITPVGPLLNKTSLIEMVSILLREVSYKTIHRVIGDEVSFLQDFGIQLAQDKICILDQLLIDDLQAINNDTLQPLKEMDISLQRNASPVIIVIASSSNIIKLMDNLESGIKTKGETFWLIVPTDSYLEVEPGILPSRSYVLSSIMPKKDILEHFLKKPEVIIDPLNHREPTKSPFFLNIASKILNILQPLKEAQFKYCGEANDTCLEFERVVKNLPQVAPQKVSKTGYLIEAEILQVLHNIRIPTAPEMFLFSVWEETTTEDFAVLQIFNQVTSLFQTVLLLVQEELIEKPQESVNLNKMQNNNMTELSKIEDDETRWLCFGLLDNNTGDCGICLNFVQFLSNNITEQKRVDVEVITIQWRYETWVAVNAAVSSIGIICIIAIFMFISIRICMGDILEGSSILSFFLLAAVLLTYAATIPFSFQTSGSVGDPTMSSIICDLRMFLPPVTSSIIFSLIFVRGLMLAACDHDGGFMSHVNGYIQAVLVFFVNGIQFVISGEYWIFNSFLQSSLTSCQSMYTDHKFLILNSYNLFLLLLLVSVIPFMYKSKRNYREGTFFSIAIIAEVIVWTIWLSLFYLLPKTQNDIVVTFGLTSTATTILIFVFIPRTYMMTTSIVRDKIVSTLPPLTNSNGNFHSSQALYDTVHLSTKTGTNNPNFYSVNPMDSGPATPQIRPGQYYSSDSEIKIPTPQRQNSGPFSQETFDTPEHTYEGYDSPFHGPKTMTRF